MANHWLWLMIQKVEIKNQLVIKCHLLLITIFVTSWCILVFKTHTKAMPINIESLLKCRKLVQLVHIDVINSLGWTLGLSDIDYHNSKTMTIHDYEYYHDLTYMASVQFIISWLKAKNIWLWTIVNVRLPLYYNYWWIVWNYYSNSQSVYYLIHE